MEIPETNLLFPKGLNWVLGRHRQLLHCPIFCKPDRIKSKYKTRRSLGGLSSNTSDSNFLGNNGFRNLSNSLRLSSQQIRYIFNTFYKPLKTFQKKNPHIFLVLLSLPLRGCKFWTLSIGSETNM